MLLGYKGIYPITRDSLVHWTNEVTARNEKGLQDALTSFRGQLFEHLRQQEESGKRLNIASSILGSMHNPDVDKALALADELLRRI